jgi:hypothetical protein
MNTIEQHISNNIALVDIKHGMKARKLDREHRLDMELSGHITNNITFYGLIFIAVMILAGILLGLLPA